jgi:hypothetical protein
VVEGVDLVMAVAVEREEVMAELMAVARGVDSVVEHLEAEKRVVCSMSKSQFLR